MNLKLVLSILFSFNILLLSAQDESDTEEDGQYYDLLMLYMDADYEKCVLKSVKYTEKDKTKGDPLPYLYASMCFYEANNIEDLKAFYGTPLKDALKYMGKYRRKDRDLIYWADHLKFIEDLRTEAKAEALNQFNEGKDAKAKYYYKQILKFDPDDYSCQAIMAYLLAYSGDEYNATAQFEEFEATINKVEFWDNEPQDKKELLGYSFTKYADWLNSKGRSDSAYSTVKRLEGYLGAEDSTVKRYLEKYQK